MKQKQTYEAPRRRNEIAKALADVRYRQRIVANKKAYNRKQKWDSE